MMKLNQQGYRAALELVRGGKVDRDSAWEFTTEDENKLLGDPPDWKAYGKWFLGVREDKNEETKARYAYPYGKGGKVYRAALIAIRQRAGQQGQIEIFTAAGKLLEEIDRMAGKRKIPLARELPGQALQESLIVPIGRYFYYDSWLEITPSMIQAMKLGFDRRSTDVVVDYEHQTLSGQKAPAAGWVKEVWVAEDGLWGRIEWTDEAKRLIEAKEYRYLSPVIFFDYPDPVTGEILQAYLDSVALTNRPFLPDAPAVAGRETMKDLVALVGARDEHEARTKVENLVKLHRELARTLGEEDPSKIVGQVLALKEYREKVSQEELEKVKDELATMKAERKVEEAIKAGKVTPAQREWAIAYCKRDPEGFDAFVASAPKVVQERAVATKEPEKKQKFDEATLAIARKLGLDEEFLVKNLGGEA